MKENNLNTNNLDMPVDIIKEVSVLQDKKQTSIRIPKEIVNFLDIKKGDKFKFKVELPLGLEGEELPPKLSFEVIKNGA